VLIDQLKTKDGSFLKPGALRPIVMNDNEDAWGMTVRSFRDLAGEFKLLSKTKAAQFAGVRSATLDPVHVIEEGDARTVVEAFFQFNDSFICQRYKLPKQGTEVELEVRVHWNEKNRMLKLAVPTTLSDSHYLGQTAYGVETLPIDGSEAVAQKWVAAVSPKSNLALTCVNDGVYGSDFKDGEIRLSLLRSPAFSGHPILDRPIVPQDRYLPRIDQGERIYHFWFTPGKRTDRLEKIDREALAHNEKPFVLSFFPSGEGKKVLPTLTLDDKTVQVTAFKQAETSGDYIVRLFEPTGKAQTTTLSIPPLKIKKKITLGKFEIKTVKVNPKTRTVKEVGLMEK
jgi:alpha-mannosidase